MEQPKRDNSGALFRNDKKEQPNHPDYKGQCVVNGVEYWLSSWIKKSQAGQTFMSLALTPKQQQTPPQQSAPARTQTQANAPKPDDDFPPF
jgi:uncharacterized protein (DUF736 family)